MDWTRCPRWIATAPVRSPTVAEQSYSASNNKENHERPSAIRVPGPYRYVYRRSIRPRGSGAGGGAGRYAGGGLAGDQCVAERGEAAVPAGEDQPGGQGPGDRHAGRLQHDLAG